jgi:hypothetical protein
MRTDSILSPANGVGSRHIAQLPAPTASPYLAGEVKGRVDTGAWRAGSPREDVVGDAEGFQMPAKPPGDGLVPAQ